MKLTDDTSTFAFKAKNWALLLFIVLALGSSFALNKVALTSFPTVWIVTLRMVLAALTLTLFSKLSGRKLPGNVSIWLWAAWLAFIGNLLPFGLVTWGTNYLPTGLIGVLVAPTPLMMLLLAHFLLPDEELTAPKFIGACLGISGVLALLGFDILRQFDTSGNSFWVQLVVFLATICFALNAVSVRLMPRVDRISFTAGVMIMASLMSVPVALFLSEFPNPASLVQSALLSVVVLGLVTSAATTVAIYVLIDRAGIGFMSIMNYLIPACSLGIGLIAFGEPMTTGIFVGLGLILAGIGVSGISGKNDPRVNKQD